MCDIGMCVSVSMDAELMDGQCVAVEVALLDHNSFKRVKMF